MALQLGDDFFEEIGLGTITLEQKQKLRDQLIETLQLRVGSRLAEDLSEEQLDEFEQTIASADDASTTAETWLKVNNPHYETIIAEEVDALKSELRTDLNIVMQ